MVLNLASPSVPRMTFFSNMVSDAVNSSLKNMNQQVNILHRASILPVPMMPVSNGGVRDGIMADPIPVRQDETFVTPIPKRVDDLS